MVAWTYWRNVVVGISCFCSSSDKPLKIRLVLSSGLPRMANTYNLPKFSPFMADTLFPGSWQRNFTTNCSSASSKWVDQCLNMSSRFMEPELRDMDLNRFSTKVSSSAERMFADEADRLEPWPIWNILLSMLLPCNCQTIKEVKHMTIKQSIYLAARCTFTTKYVAIDNFTTIVQTRESNLQTFRTRGTLSTAIHIPQFSRWELRFDTSHDNGSTPVPVLFSERFAKHPRNEVPRRNSSGSGASPSQHYK